MILPIQASVQGYGGKPATVYSVLDTDAGVLVIDVLAAFRRERLGEAALLTNDPAIADRDAWFTDKDFAAAVGAYFGFKHGVATDGASPALVFGERAARANPIAVVEHDGFDVQGIRYRLAEGVENAHVAVLATCRYAREATGQEQAVGMMAAMAANPLLQGGLLTIGEQPNYVMLHGFAVDARFVP